MEKIDIQKQFKVQVNEDLKRYEFNSIDDNSVSYTVGFHEASTIEDAYIAVYLAIQKDTKSQPSEQSPSEASEQKPVVTQSEKGETIEEIWEKIVYTQHVESGDEAYIIEKDDFIKAMQEYSLLERSRAIDECQETVNNHMGSENLTARILLVKLENLKSRQ